MQCAVVASSENIKRKLYGGNLSSCGYTVINRENHSIQMVSLRHDSGLLEGGPRVHEIRQLWIRFGCALCVVRVERCECSRINTLFTCTVNTVDVCVDVYNAVR